MPFDTEESLRLTVKGTSEAGTGEHNCVLYFNTNHKNKVVVYVERVSVVLINDLIDALERIRNKSGE